jgi:hypothetical protein
MKTLIILLTLAMRANEGCSIEPIKPLPPVGCKDLIAQCVCDAKAECHWQWVCVPI